MKIVDERERGITKDVGEEILEAFDEMQKEDGKKNVVYIGKGAGESEVQKEIKRKVAVTSGGIIHGKTSTQAAMDAIAAMAIQTIGDDIYPMRENFMRRNRYTTDVYNMTKEELTAEYELIQQKKSKKSAALRKKIVARFETLYGKKEEVKENKLELTVDEFNDYLGDKIPMSMWTVRDAIKKLILPNGEEIDLQKPSSDRDKDSCIEQSFECDCNVVYVDVHQCTDGSVQLRVDDIDEEMDIYKSKILVEFGG